MAKKALNSFVLLILVVLTAGAVRVISGSDYLASAARAAASSVSPPGTWTATGALATERAWHTATLLTGGRVLAAGG